MKDTGWRLTNKDAVTPNMQQWRYLVAVRQNSIGRWFSENVTKRWAMRDTDRRLCPLPASIITSS